MSFHERLRKLELANAAKRNKVTMIWVEDISELSESQKLSSNEIYIYLEI